MTRTILDNAGFVKKKDCISDFHSIFLGDFNRVTMD